MFRPEYRGQIDYGRLFWDEMTGILITVMLQKLDRNIECFDRQKN